MKTEIWVRLTEDGIISFGGICKAKDFKEQIKKLEKAGLKEVFFNKLEYNVFKRLGLNKNE